MMNKQIVKQSEARIMVYLSIVHNTRKHVTAISNKLEIDYSYLLRILPSMVAKRWLIRHKVRRHVFYDLTAAAPLELALKMYENDPIQKDLRDNYTTKDPEVQNEPANKVSERTTEGTD